MQLFYLKSREFWLTRYHVWLIRIFIYYIYLKRINFTNGILLRSYFARHFADPTKLFSPWRISFIRMRESLRGQCTTNYRAMRNHRICTHANFRVIVQTMTWYAANVYCTANPMCVNAWACSLAFLEDFSRDFKSYHNYFNTFKTCK